MKYIGGAAPVRLGACCCCCCCCCCKIYSSCELQAEWLMPPVQEQVKLVRGALVQQVVQLIQHQPPAPATSPGPGACSPSRVQPTSGLPVCSMLCCAQQQASYTLGESITASWPAAAPLLGQLSAPPLPHLLPGICLATAPPPLPGKGLHAELCMRSMMSRSAHHQDLSGYLPGWRSP
jgi:hypothetical protein